MRNFLSYFLFLFGLFCFLLSGYAFLERSLPGNLSFSVKQPIIKACINHNKIPVEIIIPSLALKLPIIPSSIKNGVWETTNEGVSYLLSSPIPGQAGNSILYGHNFTRLLGKLPQMKPGNEISIIYNDNSQEKFLTQFTSIVSPNQIDILKPSQDKRITVYTCTGFLDSERFVVVAVAENS